MRDKFLQNLRLILFLVTALFPALALVAQAQDQAFVCFDEEAMVSVVESRFETAQDMALSGRCLWVVLYLPSPGTHIKDIDEYSVWVIPTLTEFGLMDVYYFTRHKPPDVIILDGDKA